MWLNKLPLKVRIGLGTILAFSSFLAFVILEGRAALETAFGFALLFGVLALVWLVTRSIVKPVQRLQMALAQVSAGDLATPLPELGRDEIGALGAAFEHMRQKLACSRDEMERPGNAGPSSPTASRRSLISTGLGRSARAW